MIVLGIDTATPSGSVAIVEDGRVIAETRSTDGRGADLLVMIDAVCIGAAIGAHDLDAVAIGAGPGSFTGLRIGMATAKGIAFAAACPLWAVSSLAALVYPALVETPGIAIGVLDARRGELYAGAYVLDGDRIISLGTERVGPPAELATLVREASAAHATLMARAGDVAVPAPVRFYGDAVDAYPDAFRDLATAGATGGLTPTGAAVARLALAGARVDVLVGGAPSYIRPPEAEIRYPDGVPGALRKR